MIYVRLNKAGELQDYLGDERDFADFLFNKYKKPGDVFETITRAQFQKLQFKNLQADPRYREACKIAALKKVQS